jgi:hypothetical protein
MPIGLSWPWNVAAALVVAVPLAFGGARRWSGFRRLHVPVPRAFIGDIPYAIGILRSDSEILLFAIDRKAALACAFRLWGISFHLVVSTGCHEYLRDH